MNSTALYGVAAVGFAVFAVLAFTTYGGGSYMLVLYGVVLAVVFAGFAYDEHRSTAEQPTTRAR